MEIEIIKEVKKSVNVKLADVEQQQFGYAMNAVVGSVLNMEAPLETEQSQSILICVSDAKEVVESRELCRHSNIN